MEKKNKIKFKNKYYSFEKTKEIIKAEQFPSPSAFKKWYRYNLPRLIPFYPDKTYKNNGWNGWDDFLGKTSKYVSKVQKYHDWDAARRLVAPFKFKSAGQWLLAAKNKKIPNGIPTRPDFYYEEWISWKHFFGVEFAPIVEEVVKIVPILYILKKKFYPNNVFTINITYGGANAVKEVIKDSYITIIRLYECEKEYNWEQIILKYGHKYFNGFDDEYMFYNINELIYELDCSLNKASL